MNREKSVLMSSLLTIPNELLDEITSTLDPVTTFYLLLTCRSLSARVLPAMRLHAVTPKDKMPALHWAATKGHLPLVQYLLTVFPVDLLDARGNTALHRAALGSRALVTEQLLLHGAAVNRFSPGWNYTPIMHVCRGELRNTDAAEATIRILLAHGADVQSYPLHTPIWAAIIWCSPRGARLFLEAGASPDAKTESGQPMVVTAARKIEYAEVLQILLQAGVIVDARNAYGISAVMEAASRGFLPPVQTLVANGANLNFLDRDGESAFSFACKSGNKGLVDYLVRCDGLDINGTNLGERAPVYLTVRHKYAAAFKVLLQRGASMDYIDDEGRSIVQFAVQKGCHKIVRALLDHGVNIETADTEGFTPLMDAVNMADILMTTMLLDHQPDRSRDGFETLILACAFGSIAIVELLLERGTDINRVDERGMTVMAEAQEHNWYAVVEMLASYGGVIEGLKD